MGGGVLLHLRHKELEQRRAGEREARGGGRGRASDEERECVC